LAARDDHLRQARENRRLALALIEAHQHDPCAVQWVVTMAFYSAVHGVEAHLARYGEHSGEHAGREALMAVTRFGIPARVFEAYKRLKGWSRNGRYELRQFTPDWVRTRVFSNLDIIIAFADSATP
jgi:hypothetical protein